jgi:EmrB/QacA subfamily drug resistance transporter
VEQQREGLRAPDRKPPPSNRKWWILSVVTLVAFVTNLDGTIVIVGLPRMVAGLHITVTTGLWTLTSYIITSTVFLLPAGRWSELYGQKRIFMAGLLVFTLATFLCGTAPTGSWLLVFRFVQGSGAALALATATPIIVRAFPKEQLGRALGINSTAWVMGSIVGPVVGGILVSAFGWRWIFFVTIPFALMGVVGAWRILTDAPRQRGVGVDGVGAITFGLGVTALLVALSMGQAWGWASVNTLGLFGLTALLGTWFVVAERLRRDPMFDLALMRHAHYRSGLLVTISYSIGYFATTFLLTIYLQGAAHLNPLQAGLMLVPLSAPQLVMGPVGGALADRYGPARLVAVGILLLAVGGFWLGHLGPTFSAVPIILPLLLMSVANGLSWPALTKAVMSSAPAERTGTASGMFFTFRNVGMALSLTLALVVAEVSLPPAVASRVYLGTSSLLSPAVKGALIHATNTAFWAFVGFYLLAFLLAVPLQRSHRGAGVEGTPASGR